MINTILKHSCHKCETDMFCEIITTDTDWVEIDMISNLASFTCPQCWAEHYVSNSLEIEVEDDE